MCLPPCQALCWSLCGPGQGSDTWRRMHECKHILQSHSRTPCSTIHHVKGTGLLPGYFPCQEQMYIRLLIKQQPGCT